MTTRHLAITLTTLAKLSWFSKKENLQPARTNAKSKIHVRTTTSLRYMKPRRRVATIRLGLYYFIISCLAIYLTIILSSFVEKSLDKEIQTLYTHDLDHTSKVIIFEFKFTSLCRWYSLHVFSHSHQSPIPDRLQAMDIVPRPTRMSNRLSLRPRNVQPLLTNARTKMQQVTLCSGGVLPFD